jgi:hypothetical protein
MEIVRRSVEWRRVAFDVKVEGFANLDNGGLI